MSDDPRDLHCYFVSDPDTHIAAYDPKDARELYLEQVNPTPEDDLGDFVLCDPAEMLVVSTDTTEGVVTKSIGQWMLEIGRGVICCEDWG